MFLINNLLEPAMHKGKIKKKIQTKKPKPQNEQTKKKHRITKKHISLMY